MKWGNSPFKPSTTATLSFCFNDKVYFKTMAIPFYDEISGHPSSHQSNSTNNSFIHQPSVNNNNDGNRQRRQVSGDGRVIISASPAINSGVTSQQVSFLHQLITELAHIYNSFAPSSSSPSQPVVAQESRASPMQLNQDNQTNEHAGTAGRLLPLPDLVSCHQLPPRSSTSSSSSSWSGGGPPYANTLNNNNDVNEDEDETDEDSESSSFGLKLSVECTYRSIGSDLRRIADSFDPQTPQRSIHSSRRCSRPVRRTLKVEIGLKVVVPSILIGLGWAYLRKSS